MKTVIYKDGIIVQTIDTRTLESGKAELIALYKEITSKDILEKFPQHKQINAALGLYSSEESARISNGIATLRDAFSAKEAAINACTTLAEVDAL